MKWGPLYCRRRVDCIDGDASRCLMDAASKCCNPTVLSVPSSGTASAMGDLRSALIIISGGLGSFVSVLLFICVYICCTHLCSSSAFCSASSPALADTASRMSRALLGTHCLITAHKGTYMLLVMWGVACLCDARPKNTRMVLPSVIQHFAAYLVAAYLLVIAPHYSVLVSLASLLHTPPGGASCPHVNRS